MEEREEAEKVQAYLVKKITRNLTILLLGLYSRETHTQYSICTFVATLFITAKTLAQSKYLS